MVPGGGSQGPSPFGMGNGVQSVSDGEDRFCHDVRLVRADWVPGIIPSTTMGVSAIGAAGLAGGMDEADPTVDVACTLTAEGRAAHPAAVRAALVATYRGTEDRADGYTLRFDGPARSLPAVAASTASERRCCSVATDAIEVAPAHETVALTITGPEGTGDVFADLVGRLEGPTE